MAKKYNHREVEQKWQKKWAQEKLYQTEERSSKPKYYVLDMFPYPSGAGLHVGHPKGYIATDIVARQKMMQGYNVLHPMGWDGFGLPAENYALKNKVHPAAATAKNVEVFKKQLEILGFTYDWEREINTTDPDFYQWTQWIFLQLYRSYYDERLDRAQPIERLMERKFGTDNYYQLNDAQKAEIDAQRLAYEEYAPINWCPSCQTGLANEDLEDGRCERCDSVIEKKPMRQWILRITKYADRLLADLEGLDWEPFIKTMQTNWIGKSCGAEVTFTLFGDFPCQASASQNPRTSSTLGFCSPRLPRKSLKYSKSPHSNGLGEIKIFTTRIDTLFGCTYLVMAPEKVTEEILTQLPPENRKKVESYCKNCKNKSEQERTDQTKPKTGIILAGIAGINPVNGEAVPVLVADYVLGDYGTGVVMGVPAHDERDFEFATKHGLPIKKVIDVSSTLQKSGKNVRSTWQKSGEKMQEAVTEDGFLVNSGKYDGLASSEARKQILADLVRVSQARGQVNYKLREWVFSRQRYWGEPIPMIHCEKCGNVSLSEKDLPLKLPEVEHYEPSGTGESPLVNIKEWVEVKCPICGGPARRETNTMPQWAGSSWYYLRYIDPHNKKRLIDPQKEQYMMPVDFYVGGAEHATRHLIYARFWHKFLYDLGVVTTKEPFAKLQHVGLILAEDGRKMSKRWNNVINPDEIVGKYGADAMRVYEMFMAPFGSPSAWNMQGLVGVRKFLVKVWELQEKVILPEAEVKKPAYLSLLHQTIKKVTLDIADFKLNTVVSGLMILANAMQEAEVVQKRDYEQLVKLLAPLAPHLAEEIWAELGHQTSIFKESWPDFDPDLAKAELIILPIQINGKMRDQLEVGRELIDNEEEIWQLTMARAKVKKYLQQGKVVKKIYVPGRILNLVLQAE